MIYVITQIISGTVLYNIFFILYILTILSIIIVVITENRNPVKSLAWVTVLLMLPIAGVVIYIFFGRNFKSKRLIRRRNKQKIKSIGNTSPSIFANTLPQLSEESADLLKLGKTINSSDYYTNNKIDIYTHARDKFDQFIKDICAAQDYINIQYYIFENDKLGNEIKDLLIEKVKQGVKVRIIYDHVGCFKVRNSFYRQMKAHGIEVEPFMRVTFPQFATRINWRNHRKVTIIDGKIGYIGGMNIANRYINGGKHAYWRDTHIRICGNAVIALEKAFSSDWSFMGNQPLADHVEYFPPADGYDAGIQLITSGPMSSWSNMSMMLFKAISGAKRSIYIQTPYFLPTDSLLKALQAAALSGVDVRLMMPKQSDSMMLTLASYSYIKSCLLSGIKVYLYQKGMLHAKTLIIDDELSSTGSTNFDFRSMEHNFECNAFIYGKEFNTRMKDIFNRDLKDCRRISKSSWGRRPVIQKFKESVVRLFSPIL